MTNSKIQKGLSQSSIQLSRASKLVHTKLMIDSLWNSTYIKENYKVAYGLFKKTHLFFVDMIFIETIDYVLLLSLEP